MPQVCRVAKKMINLCIIRYFCVNLQRRIYCLTKTGSIPQENRMIMRTFSICAIALFALMTTARAQNPFDDNTKVIDTQHVPDPTRDGQADIKYDTKGNEAVQIRKNVGGRQSADLGLSVLWATSNIDAANARGYYGRIVAWGELKAKDTYTTGNSTNYGKARRDIKGDPFRDAATSIWQGGWRMPTYEEMKELREKCTWKWTIENGRWGYKVISKINKNYIFLPAVGFNRSSRIEDMNAAGYYWTSTPYTNHNSAWRLQFTQKGINLLQGARFEGCYIRPVHDK